MKFMSGVDKDIDELIWYCDSILGEDNNVSEELYQAKDELNRWRIESTPPPPIHKNRKMKKGV